MPNTPGVPDHAPEPDPALRRIRTDPVPPLPAPGVPEHDEEQPTADTPAPYRRVTRKVAGASLGGTPFGVALAGAILWLLDEYAFTTGPVPDALVVLVWAVIPLLASLAAGYLTKLSSAERAAVVEGRL